MAFTFAYSLDGDEINVIQDLPLDTAANYNSGAGTNGPTRGDLVYYSAGLLRRNIATTANGASVGVLEGIEFVGLVNTGAGMGAGNMPYYATNASFTASAINTTAFPNGVAKVRTNKSDNIFRLPLKSGLTAMTNANRGVSYGIALSATGDQTLDTGNTTNLAVKVVDISTDGLTAYVLLV